MSSDPTRNHTLDLPDEVLALVFACLPSTDRDNCSLTCHRWYAVDAATRTRLSLDARSGLAVAASILFNRFASVTKLALRCDRRRLAPGAAADSLTDSGAIALAASLPSCLTRLKLRGLRQLTDAGLAALGANCGSLRKLSVASCALGPKAFASVLRSCALLEDLSVKRLRGLPDSYTTVDPLLFPEAASLRSVCLKDLYSALCFVPLVAASPNLRSLKILRCSGAWDQPLEDIASQAPGILELHLEKLQVCDRGLAAVSAFKDLEVLFLVKTPECTDKGIAAVAEKCRKLRKLHIDGWRTNLIGDLGLIAVARGCPELQELVLIGVNPTTTSLSLIAEFCKMLERLALCGCETVGDAEITCLATRCAALKKLCIKGCPVSDNGMAALAKGCPCLVKVKLKRCRGVTAEGIEWLKEVRGESFSVSLDALELMEQDAMSLSESGAQETVVEPQVSVLADQVAALDLPSSSSGQSSAQGRNRVRSFVASALRKFSNNGGGGGGGGNPPQGPQT